MSRHPNSCESLIIIFLQMDFQVRLGSQEQRDKVFKVKKLGRCMLFLFRSCLELMIMPLYIHTLYINSIF